MPKEDLIKRLKLDCNSLNSIAGTMRFFKNGQFNIYSEILLGIEDRIFQAIDMLEEIKNTSVCDN